MKKREKRQKKLRKIVQNIAEKAKQIDFKRQITLVNYLNIVNFSSEYKNIYKINNSDLK